MKPIFHFLLLLLAVACSAQQPVDNGKQAIVFRNVNVIPMHTDQVLQQQDVVVQKGKVISLNPSGKAKFPKQALVVDGTGKYLMPGLAEMHAHVPPIDDLEPMKEVLQLFAVNGVTLIRGMLGHPRHLELRSKVNSGEILGPRFFTSGPSFNGSSIKTPEAAANLVRSQQQAGYDFLKLHPGLTKENFRVMATTAQKVGIPFAGHVSFDVGIWDAIDAKYATIDHLDGFVESLVPGMETIKEQEAGLFGMFVGHKADTAGIEKLMTGLRNNNIWVVPTQALAERWFHPERTADMLANEPEMKYMSADAVKGWINSKKNIENNARYNASNMLNFIQLRRQLINACNRYGVKLLLGSDAPQVFDVPGFSIHHELQYMVDAGLTPYEALRTGTVYVGEFYKRPDWGVIKPGAASDLLLLNGNPLNNVAETRNIEGVMLGTRWLNKTYINATLKSLEKQ